MSAALRNRLILSLALAVAASLLFPACGEDGESPLCPEVHRYDIGNAGERNSAEVKADRDAAVDAGCMTPLMLDAGTD